MFLFGILSSPLPYLLMAAFYFIGFAAGMFHKEAAKEEVKVQVQVNNIHVNNSLKVLNKAEDSFHFYQYKVDKKVVDCKVKSIQPPPQSKEKLIYFVHDIRIPHTSISDFYFCRPPPTIG